MEYVICPSILYQSWLKPYSPSWESLMNTMCSNNWHKIYIDTEWMLLFEYQEKLKRWLDTSLIKLFTNYLETKIENFDEDRVSKINISNFTYSDPRELISKLWLESSNNILVQNKIDYKKYSLPPINLFDANDFLKIHSLNTTNIGVVNWWVISQPTNATQNINIKNRFKKEPYLSILFTWLLINWTYDVIKLFLSLFNS